MKKILRKKLIYKRKKYYLEISSNKIVNISNFIKKNYKTIKIVGGYIPINYEYNCLNLLKFLESKNYSICLPVIKKNFQMNFYKYTFTDPLKINNLYFIAEPLWNIENFKEDTQFNHLSQQLHVKMFNVISNWVENDTSISLL